MMKYENSPPPSDVEYEDVPIFFTLSRPQNVYIRDFLSVDYSLIHPRLLGLEIGENLNRMIENKTNKTGQEDVHKDLVNEKIEPLNVTENEKLDVISVADKNTTNMAVCKKKRRLLKDTENSSKVQGSSTDKLQKRKHVSIGKKRRKCHRTHQSTRVISSVDSDESNIIGTTVQDLRCNRVNTLLENSLRTH